MTDAIMHTYKRLPVSFVRGEGVWLYDDANKRYFDALTGIAVCGLGHAHPAVAEAVSRQASTLVHTSNLYRIPLQEELAEELTAKSGMERVFFCNSGAEANEASLKVARAYGNARGISTPTVVTFQGSFHGRTMAALSATGNDAVKKGFTPMLAGFEHVPYNDIEAVRALTGREDICAVLIEPVLGEGGVVLPEPGFLAALQALCHENEWLFMLDEVQTGMGRSGRWFAHQHDDLEPDVMALAKGLGNGVPIGACLVARKAVDALGPGSHGSTFGGTPLASSAALAVIRTIEREGLCERAAELGDRLVTGLREALSGDNVVREVRGRGLMIGLELERPCAELVPLALERGLLINVTAERVLRLLPPLIMTDEDVEFLLREIPDLIRSWNGGT